jgi:hypothetical protein
MKNKVLIISILTVFTVICVFIIYSCSKDEGSKNQITSDLNKYKYSKQITLFDKSGNNSIVLNFAAKDPSQLNDITDESYSLIALKANEIYEPKEDNIHRTSVQINTEEPSISSEADLIITEISKNFQTDIVRYVIRREHPKDDTRADWQTTDYNSYTCDCATLNDECIWHSVYYGFNYKLSATDIWNVSVGFPTKVGLFNTVHPCMSPSYAIQLKVKYKYTSCFSYAFDTCN